MYDNNKKNNLVHIIYLEKNLIHGQVHGQFSTCIFNKIHTEKYNRTNKIESEAYQKIYKYIDSYIFTLY